eukprot:gene10568-10728_t
MEMEVAHEQQPLAPHFQQDGNTKQRLASSASGQEAQNRAVRFKTIVDSFTTLDQVTAALRQEGLESSNLIVAVDFTKSNEWTGKYSFGGRSLHHLGQARNPYEEVITAIGKTLSSFDDDQLVPAYGFGDVSCQDQDVFSFNVGDVPCPGLDAVLTRYRQLCPHVRLAGPTSFAPAIRRACKVVADSGGQFHILLLVADGQVTRSSDLPPDASSVQEADTIKALVAASSLPLSIVMVGVGDGPWDVMKQFDDKLPQRTFDNFQFVNYTEIMSRFPPNSNRVEPAFALAALMEIPEQYKGSGDHGLTLPLTYREMTTEVITSGYFLFESFPRSADQRRHPEVMRNPVIAADGYTYDRSAIQTWLNNNDRSPMTNKKLANRTLTPNHTLRSAILEAQR